ncbi:MAG: single-stranded-DNA-specific exonuclease RecJ [Rhizobiales bacterium]|nr:single-stranded-DNA-specific exonuclease RecJ [Hyphomicrobiales bacterium]
MNTAVANRLFEPDLPARAFLGVERSLTGRRWIDRLDAAGTQAALAIAQRHEVPDIVARILAGRGVAPDDAAAFLEPSVKTLMPDPSSITEMDAAAARIATAIIADEPIALFGDYDVDGASSSALFARFLRAQGRDAAIYIPDRIFEGYGPNPDAIRKLAGQGAKLLVTLDCGSTSHEAIAVARELGMDVVVIDHHQVGIELPKANVVVNPNRHDDLSGLGYLAAVGVTFLAVVAVNRELRNRGWYGEARPEPQLLAWLDLVALGTVCDVVPLVGLNRAFVSKGLLALARRGNRGLAALADVARLGGPVQPYHLGFVFGPRINAGGRIGNAALGATLLVSDDPAECEQIAAELDRLNRERQAMETVMLEEACAEVEAEIRGGFGPAVLVTGSSRWHPGVVGLIAARLKERYGRPAIAVAFNPNGTGAGSGRSIAGIDLGHAVREAVERGILIKGGGHAMAAGLTIAHDRLGDFRAYLEETLHAGVHASREAEGLPVDAALSARGATVELIDLIERAGPFGAGHADPLVALPAHRIAYAEVVGNAHLRMALAGPDGTSLKAVLFRGADSELGRALAAARGEIRHIAGILSVDQWQGRRTPSLRVIDAAVPTSP